MRTVIRLLVPLVVLAACTPASDAVPPTAAAPKGGVVDSILPISVQLDRFREGLAEPEAFGGTVASAPDSLATLLLSALERSDSAALAGMALSRAEFAWLYYPHHIYAAAPYELGPGTFWTLIQGNSEKGRLRLIQRLSGSRFEFRGMTCEPGTAVSAPVRELINCKVRLLLGGAPQEMQLFGSIVERDGRYKFVSFANDF